jgi:hypothetical protein
MKILVFGMAARSEALLFALVFSITLEFGDFDVFGWDEHGFAVAPDGYRDTQGFVLDQVLQPTLADRVRTTLGSRLWADESRASRPGFHRS